MKAMLKYGIILGLICLIATGLLAAVNSCAKPRIIAEAQKEIAASLKEVVPEAENFEPIKFQNEIVYYKGFAKNKTLTGLAFIARGKGYSSIIETMAGIKPDGTIIAIKILNQNETPGLGSRICEIKDNTTIFDIFKGKRQNTALKPWFQEQFFQKKDYQLDGINAITGATISSRAVISAVKNKIKEIQKLIKQ